MEAEARAKNRHLLAFPKPLRLPDQSKDHNNLQKSPFKGLFIPDSLYKFFKNI